MSRDVTFDETSMVKSMNSQQVESEKINRISQQVENDATPLFSDKSVSFEITYEVTQGDDLHIGKLKLVQSLRRRRWKR